ncbi:MAG: CHAT domain-containing protein, partial [Gaiellaceae bacterium]
MEYDTLQIRLQPSGDDTYHVVATAPGVETAGKFRVPFDARDLKIFVLEVGRTRRGARSLNSPQMESAKGFGSELFDALFSADVRDVYHSASAQAESAGKGLRITLLLGQAPELMHVPWEYLCDDGRFLSVSERTPIVRYLDLKKAHKPLPVEPPLRIVGMVSSPIGVVELDVGREKQRLEAALEHLTATGQVEIVWLERATLGELLKALERDDFHVFHYIGHGQFDEQAGDGVLIFEDAQGRPNPVTGLKLGHVLHDERTLQLAVLNACEGARTDRNDPFAGVAASLVKDEIPSVIAMQFEVTDEAAIVFAEGFYSALARGSPVDAALASARKAIWAEANDVEWGTPVLFMRVPDGRVFDLHADPARLAEAGALDEPALEVRLGAEPATVDIGDEVAWRLTISNAGKSALAGLTAGASDGSTLVTGEELLPGRKHSTSWRSRPATDTEATVTVTATDVHGDRITEQVNAHVEVRPSPGEAKAVTPRAEARAESAAGASTEHGPAPGQREQPGEAQRPKRAQAGSERRATKAAPARKTAAERRKLEFSNWIEQHNRKEVARVGGNPDAGQRSGAKATGGKSPTGTYAMGLLELEHLLRRGDLDAADQHSISLIRKASGYQTIDDAKKAAAVPASL